MALRDMIWKWMSDRKNDFFRGGYEATQGLAEMMMKRFGDLWFGTSPAIYDEVQKKMETWLDGIIDRMGTVMYTDKPEVVEKTKEIMREHVFPIIKLGLIFEFASTAAEFMHPAKEIGAKNISHMLHDTFGFDSLTKGYVRPLRDTFIRLPVRYELFSIFRPKKPYFSDGIDWYGRGHIGDSQLHEFLGWYGLPDDWHFQYKRKGSKPASYFMLNAIGREGLYDEKAFKFFLSDAGFAAFEIKESELSEYEKDYDVPAPGISTVDFLADTYKRMSARVEWSGIKALARKHYSEGLITKEKFTEYFKKSFVGDDVIALELALLDLEKEDEKKDLARSQVEQLYAKRLIPSTEFSSRLLGLGYSKEAVEDLLELADLKRAAKDIADLTTVQICTAFKKAVITETDTRKRLTNKGYVTTDVDILLELYTPEQSSEEARSITTSQVLRAYREKVLSESEVRSRLGKMAYTDVDADILLDLYEPKEE